MGEVQRLLLEPTFNRAVKVQSTDERLTSDAGVLLLCEADHRLGLVESLAAKLHDARDPANAAAVSPTRPAPPRLDSAAGACALAFGAARVTTAQLEAAPPRRTTWGKGGAPAPPLPPPPPFPLPADSRPPQRYNANVMNSSGWTVHKNPSTSSSSHPHPNPIGNY